MKLVLLFNTLNIILEKNQSEKNISLCLNNKFYNLIIDIKTKSNIKMNFITIKEIVII